MRATSKCQLFVAYANAQGDLASQIRERNASDLVRSRGRERRVREHGARGRTTWSPVRRRQGASHATSRWP